MDLQNIRLMTLSSKFLVIKLGSMVCDEGMRETISTDDILPNELVYLLVRHVDEGFSFYPLSKIVYCDDEVLESSSGGRQWSHQINSSHGEWPRGSYGCQQCLWSSSDRRKTLALVTFLSIGYTISPHRRPIVSLSHYPL